MGWADKVDSRVAKSFVGRWFRLDGSGHVSLTSHDTLDNYATLFRTLTPI